MCAYSTVLGTLSDINSHTYSITRIYRIVTNVEGLKIFMIFNPEQFTPEIFVTKWASSLINYEIFTMKLYKKYKTVKP